MAAAKLCAADGCGKPAKHVGYCDAHYQRLYKYGRLELKYAERGSVDRWMLETAIPYSGDECLTFPFAKDRNGYGHISDRKGTRTSGAHIFIAERAIGPKPSPAHEVCHSCGNGHLACVNPRHLYWGTRKENVADARKHGTFSGPPRHIGSRHPKTKLQEDQVLSIRERLSSGERPAAVAKAFGIECGTVCNIRDRRTWRHI
jgi:hypothetical protein